MDPYLIGQVLAYTGAVVGTVAASARWGAPKVKAAVRICSALADLPEQLAGISAELKTNGGGSMRDEIRRIAVDGRDTKALVRVLGDSHPDMLWEAGPTGDCVYSNETYLRETGRSLGDTLGWGWINCIAEHDRARVREAWEAAIEERREFRMRYAMVNARGDEFGVECVARVKRDHDKVVGWLGQVRRRTPTGQHVALRLHQDDGA
jgi:PAS domain S-box-containing protein